MEKISKHLKNWKYTNSMKMANNKRLGISNVLLFLNFLYLDLGESRLANSWSLVCDISLKSFKESHSCVSYKGVNVGYLKDGAY